MTASPGFCRLQHRRSSVCVGNAELSQPCALLNFTMGKWLFRTQTRTTHCTSEQNVENGLQWDERNGFAENVQLQVLSRSICLLSLCPLHCACMILLSPSHAIIPIRGPPIRRHFFGRRLGAGSRQVCEWQEEREVRVKMATYLSTVSHNASMRLAL